MQESKKNLKKYIFRPLAAPLGRKEVRCLVEAFILDVHSKFEPNRTIRLGVRA